MHGPLSWRGGRPARDLVKRLSKAVPESVGNGYHLARYRRNGRSAVRLAGTGVTFSRFFLPWHERMTCLLGPIYHFDIQDFECLSGVGTVVNLLLRNLLASAKKGNVPDKEANISDTLFPSLGLEKATLI